MELKGNLFLFAALLRAASVSASELVFIGMPGNEPAPVRIEDRANWYRPGSVAQPYRLASAPVSNAEYCEFLNCRAADDARGLFDPRMRIVRSGAKGSWSYAPAAGAGPLPVGFVTRTNAARFCNWLTNGRGGGDTETGAYTIRHMRLSGGESADMISGPRDLTAPDALVICFLPDIDEWYKGMYFDPAAGSWRDDSAPGPGKEWLEERRGRSRRDAVVAGGREKGRLFTLVSGTHSEAGLGFRVAATAPLHFGTLLNGSRNLFRKDAEKAALKFRSGLSGPARIRCRLRDYRGGVLWEREFSAAPGVGTFEFDPPASDGYYELHVRPDAPEFRDSRIVIPLAVAREPAAPGPGGRFGLCAHIGKWEEGYTNEPAEETLERLRVTGASIVRWDVGFGERDAERIRLVKQMGFTPLPIISHWGEFGAYDYRVLEHNAGNTPEAVSRRWEKRNIPPEFRMFSENVRNLVTAAGDSGHYWEMANEPTFWNIAAEDYVQFLRAGWIAAKEADPSCEVMMGDANTLYEKLFANNGGSFCDSVATHIYGYFTGEHWCLKGNIALLRNAMKRHGISGRKLWLTETNICTYSAENLIPAVSLEASRRYQAMHVPRALAGAVAAGVERVIYYNYRDTPTSHLEAEFGILDRNGLPKPAFSSYRAAVRMLGDADFVGKIGLEKSADQEIQAFAFRDGRKRDVAVLWRTDRYSVRYHEKVNEFLRPPETVVLRTSAPSVELVDLMGAVRTLKAQNGRVEVPVSETAVYVRGRLNLKTEREWLNLDVDPRRSVKRKGLVKILPPSDNRLSAKFMLPGVVLDGKPGAESLIRVRFYNHTDAPLRGRARLVPHEEWMTPPYWPFSPAESDVVIPPGGMETRTFTLRIPGRQGKERHFILKAELLLGDGGMLNDAAILRVAGE